MTGFHSSSAGKTSSKPPKTILPALIIAIFGCNTTTSSEQAKCISHLLSVTAYALRQAIDEYFSEGEQEKFARHRRVFEAISEGVANLGLKEAVKPEFRSGLVVSVRYPDCQEWDFGKVHDYLYERGFTIYPGKIDGADTFRLCAPFGGNLTRPTSKPSSGPSKRLSYTSA